MRLGVYDWFLPNWHPVHGDRPISSSGAPARSRTDDFGPTRRRFSDVCTSVYRPEVPHARYTTIVLELEIFVVAGCVVESLGGKSSPTTHASLRLRDRKGGAGEISY